MYIIIPTIAFTAVVIAALLIMSADRERNETPWADWVIKHAKVLIGFVGFAYASTLSYYFLY